MQALGLVKISKKNNFHCKKNGIKKKTECRKMGLGPLFRHHRNFGSFLILMVSSERSDSDFRAILN